MNSIWIMYMRKTISLFMLIFALAISSFSQSNSNSEFPTGPEINEKVPDFSLPDQNGNLRSIKDLASVNGALIIFHRSASWWGYCKKELVEFQGKISEFEEKGVQVIAISYDEVSALKKFSDNSNITYPLLADVGRDRKSVV